MPHESDIEFLTGAIENKLDFIEYLRNDMENPTNPNSGDVKILLSQLKELADLRDELKAAVKKNEDAPKRRFRLRK